MRAPGNINNFTTLWDTLVHRKSHHACLSTDPRFLKRFNEKDFEAVFSATPDSRETLYANLLEETPGLDEEYFGINKRDSACMDVQLKLLLHVSLEALEDAGFSGMKDGSSGDPGTFGVFIGSLSDDFCRDVNNHPIDIYHLVRNQRAFLAGQISHHFGLRGPSVSVDTACSSSMTALNDACRALATGECRAAIAGGVQVMSPFSMPSTTIALGQAGFLSTNGQCKPFLADGDGYCRSEACGLVVLKLLSDALREGDRIHGIIRSIGVGNMASSQSIIRPDGYLQSAILSKSLALAGVQPSQISFVEAHGPGTKLGDFAEIFSISTVLGHKCRNADNPLAIGSIKGNIGHSGLHLGH
ncbi:thiolase-like protein [Cyathus striatus]|nr:thiolase-like protein [Cyathus striatus]